MNAPNPQTEEIAKIADKEWRAYIEPLLPLGEQIARMYPPAADPQIRQEMFRFMYSELGAAYLQLIYASPEYPDFVPNWTQVFNNGGNLNPDNVQQFTPLDDDGIYKVSGYRGSVYIVDLQVGDSPMFAYGRRNKDKSYGPTLANYDIDEFTLGKDGAFEFILSAERPKGYTGDWRRLPPNSNYLLVRQLSYDWLNEVDARLAIERLDRPAAKPRQTGAQIKAALDGVPGWTERWVKLGIGPAEAEKMDWKTAWGVGNGDKIVLIDFTHDQGGRGAQMYICGRFELEHDEALIYEMSPGKCRYWNLHLGSEMMNTLDFMNRQVSLNGFTAKPDNDDVIRIVISAQDPGLPNWLDNMGYKAGFIWGRLDTTERKTQPTIKKVRLTDLPRHLPASTPRVSAEERDAAIRLRRKGAQLRRRW
ncbi:MAG: hypothetical protein ABW110_15090 [Steroidobacteraceae bacterium]